MNKFNYTNLTPFKWFVLENFPFIEADFDALTEWQLFCKLGKEMNKIINSENTLGRQMENVTNAFIDLQNYVNNYFDNLDVQDEINNKLNEMAQDGTLQEIIAEYLNTKSLLCFDKVSDMINSENLIEGSYAQTFGFYNINDGGSKKYKIIKEQNAQNVNGKTKINLLHDDLYAISLNDKINVKEYGAKGDGITDDTETIQFCIDNFPHRTIYIPEGKYLITSPLDIKSGNDYQVDLYLDNNAEIFSNTNIESLLNIGKTVQGTYNHYEKGAICHIVGGMWNAENCKYAIYLTADRKFTTINNVNIYNCSKYGIYIANATITNNSADAFITNSKISGIGNAIDNENIGLYIQGSDNEINEVRIQRFSIGISIHGNGNIINNIHMTQSFITEELNTENFNNSIGIDLYGSGMDFFSNIYIDTFGKAIVINSNKRSSFVNLCTFYWYNQDTSITNIFTFKTISKLYVANSDIQTTSNGTNRIINLTECTDSNFRKYFINYNNYISFINSNAIRGTLFKEYDPINCLQIENKSYSNVNPIPFSINMTQDKWYPIAILRNGFYNFKVRNGNDEACEVNIFINFDGTQVTMSRTNIHHLSHIFNLGILSFETNDGIPYKYLAIKSNDTNSQLNPSIYDISGGFFSEIYSRERFYNNNYIDNPTVEASVQMN